MGFLDWLCRRIYKDCEDLKKEYDEALALAQQIKKYLEEWDRVAPTISRRVEK